eukprot:CAMPEP_0169422554 /NCGR_PEP_ID=MMETSP1017-20121227/67014_1 /TAXON_ID=342587 /ORGANISM="Karlodinium micrum, Strain CCMP2283" /LENGTH=35 /DNA_ID= /DNA_START= /DNA_END= /DNA_ORIENTATION=
MAENYEKCIVYSNIEGKLKCVVIGGGVAAPNLRTA